MKLGTAFSDSVIIEQKTHSSFGKHKAPVWWQGSGRALLFTTILFMTLFVLGWRLFDLTLIRGHEYRVLSDGNRTRELIRHAPRGRILDRTGRDLARNEPVYRLIQPCQLDAKNPCTKILSQNDYQALDKSNLPPGTYVEEDYRRVYPSGSGASHVVGYIGEISAQELADPYYTIRGYRPGDRIGRLGAEVVYEERLRGRDGKELVEVRADGRVTRTLGRVEAIPGEDITLSLDRGLSEAATASFPEGEKGAIIVSRPSTGEIFVLMTSPSFDANIFSDSLSKSTYDGLFENPDLPMFNRAIAGTYPPGSTFKLVTALAGLEEGLLTGKTLIEDTGEVVIGPFRFGNWYFTKYGKTEGLVDIVKALQRSNDIFFYKAGEVIGITNLARWAMRLGIGKPVGIEIPGEAAGLMPDPAWKARTFTIPQDREARNDQWYLGDTYHAAIGQGYVLTTPLQVNVWTNVIANGGKLCRPTIEKVKSKCKDLELKKESIDLITEGMKRACEPGGTGWPLFNFGIDKFISVPLACKTGTSEFGDPENKTHAWFTAFAPLPAVALSKEGLADSNMITGDPELSVTVLVEGAGEGSDKAAPIAKKILEEWFSR
ncbi:hypothetical protein HY949_01255 [Candidatus Gottesmanbacteria bacterium]|nr:hypothetical protein [Candidatus Gottesmanbacteria bacterium]